MNKMTSKAESISKGYERFSFATHEKAMKAYSIIKKKYPTIIVKIGSSGSVLLIKTEHRLPLSEQVQKDVFALEGTYA